MKTQRSLFVILLIATFVLSACQNKKNKKETCCDESTVNVISNVNIPSWTENAVIYEVNLRQYTKEGTIASFKEHLPRLKKLGVEILWFMPMHPISVKNRKGTLGSYYAVQDYKAINPNYGTMEEFKALVTECHDMGFKVMLDWVANHTGWDNQWIINHPEWYQQDSLGNVMMAADWADVAQLNYENIEMQSAMIDALEFWIRETDIDGYRCDVAGMVPVEFWDKARSALDKIKPVYMLAEDESEKALLINAFNTNYGWELHHLFNKIAKEEVGVKELKAYFEKIDSTYPYGSYPMNFTSNHDENSWHGSAPQRLGDATKTLAALSFLVPGIPLIYSGQEANLCKELAFFEKDEINWDDLSMQAFYEKLIKIKQSNKALWNGAAGANIHFLHQASTNSILAFSRTLNDNKIVVLMNLSSKKASSTITCPSITGTYDDLINGTHHEFGKNPIVTMNAWEYKILKGN